MWAAVIVGIFGVVTLVVKALVDAGTRNSRVRRSIKLDLEVLDAMPEGMSHREELARLIDSDVAGLIEQRTAVVSRRGFPLFLSPRERLAWWSGLGLALAAAAAMLERGSRNATFGTPYDVTLWVVGFSGLALQLAMTAVSGRRSNRARDRHRRERRLAAADEA